MIFLKQISDTVSFHTYHHVPIKDKSIDDIKELLLFISDGIVVLCLYFIKKNRVSVETSLIFLNIFCLRSLLDLGSK